VASVPSTAVASTVVVATTGVAVTGAVVVVVVVVFLAAAFLVGVEVEVVATTGVATTGVVVTGAAGAAVFLEATVFLEAGAEVFIILVAVEVFMAGIRTIHDDMESIFDPTFIFAGL